MFKDRKDAGLQLAEALSPLKHEEPLILAIPIGGVVLGFHVAKKLECDFSVIICRKLGFPAQPEAAFGAIAEDGSIYLDSRVSKVLSEDMISEVRGKEEVEIKRSINLYRKGMPPPEMKDRTVILVDDGIATGATLFSAIQMCKNKKVNRIIVAAPVSGIQMYKILQNAGFVTLLFDLLTKEEDLDVKNRFDIDLLTERLISVTQWIKNHTEFGQWHTGYFGASTGAASAVRAAARLGVDIVEAVVSRGGRPDLASDLLDSVECPVLLIVGAKDDAVFELNLQAMEKLKSIKALITIPGATHLFEEEGAMDQVADQAGSWFEKYLYKKHLEIDKDFIV